MGRAAKANPNSKWREKHNPVQVPYPDFVRYKMPLKVIDNSNRFTRWVKKLMDSIRGINAY